MTNENRTYDLIVAIVDSNYTDEAMEAARSVGAAGGTIIRARTLSNAKAEQFIGITLAAEQEVLLILTKRESRNVIMDALKERVGLKIEAGGVIFALPVDRTVGIGAVEPEENAEAKKPKEKAKPADKAETAEKEAPAEQIAEPVAPQPEETASENAATEKPSEE